LAERRPLSRRHQNPRRARKRTNSKGWGPPALESALVFHSVGSTLACEGW
jgi:hypothetical protein